MLSEGAYVTKSPGESLMPSTQNDLAVLLRVVIKFNPQSVARKESRFCPAELEQPNVALRKNESDAQECILV